MGCHEEEQPTAEGAEAPARHDLFAHADGIEAGQKAHREEGVGMKLPSDRFHASQRNGGIVARNAGVVKRYH